MTIRPLNFNFINETTWDFVNSRLIEKIIREFSYEEMFSPVKTDENTYELSFSDTLKYRFRAAPFIYGQLVVDKDSVHRLENDTKTPAKDVNQFVLDFTKHIGMDDITAAHFIKELNNTLYADAYIHANHTYTSKEITALSYAEVEGAMHAHPWFVINKGRIGFSAEDYLHYAPEAQHRATLHYVAVEKTAASFHAISSLDAKKVMQQEVSSASYDSFHQVLLESHVNPDDYYLLPIHEWQWHNVYAMQYAKDIATKKLIYLGQADDTYLAMQSIRTFSNVTTPLRYSVKLPLSIFNTAVYRGLPGKRTKIAPALTEWVQGIYAKDDYLQSTKLVLLGEVASINYEHPTFSKINAAPYQFNELFGVIWRESIHSHLKAGEKAITMAALVHVDKNNTPIVSELIEQSGLSVHAWVKTLFEKTVPPLLHFLYQYSLVFSPHGENSILIMENGTPTRLAMKDFVDDINIAENPVPELAKTIPDSLQSVLLKVDDDYLLQFILTGLFVVHYRYLSEILAIHHSYDETTFYATLRQCILNYQNTHPSLQERFKRFNLLKPTFAKLCLNRLRILEVGYGDYSARPEVLSTGSVNNPLHQVRDTVFQTECHGHRISFRRVSLEKDLDVLHAWNNEPHVSKFWNLDKPKSFLKEHFATFLSDPHQELFIISVDGQEIAYTEVYNASDDLLCNYHPVEQGDYGWHLLIGPPEAIGKNFSLPLMQALTEYCFEAHSAKRVVFEPDVRVVPFQRTAPKLGYQNHGEFMMANKKAYFFCVSREDFVQGK